MKPRSRACDKKGEIAKLLKAVTDSVLGCLGTKGKKRKKLWSIMKFNVYNR